MDTLGEHSVLSTDVLSLEEGLEWYHSQEDPLLTCVALARKHVLSFVFSLFETLDCNEFCFRLLRQEDFSEQQRKRWDQY